MTTIDTIVACSRWDDMSTERPYIDEFTSGPMSAGSASGVCPRHGGTECLATYRIERSKP